MLQTLFTKSCFDYLLQIYALKLHNKKLNIMSKTTMRKGKQDDKNSTAIREIQAQHPANKKCFDCDQRGPTYVNMTIGSFVCTKCSGLLRGWLLYNKSGFISL